MQFLTKIMGFKKIHHGDHIKSIFFSLGKLVLQPDDHQTLFLGLYCPNTNKQEISNFLTKMIGCFCTDHQTLFRGSFVKKQNEMKFPNFDQNHGLNPVKKSQYSHSVFVQIENL